MYNKKIFNVILLVALLFMLVIPQFEKPQAQTFNLGAREYRFIDGKWYNFTGGERGDQIIPERLIARLEDHGDITQFDFSQIGLSNIIVDAYALLGHYYVLEAFVPQDPFEAATVIFHNAKFDYVEFDALGKLTATPQDQYYEEEQWNLPRIGMPSAWDITTGSSSVILAIIDTGIEYDHDDLDGNIWVNQEEDINSNGRPDFLPDPWGDLDGNDQDVNGKVDDLIGWDFYEDDENPTPLTSHGTNVAGIAAAQTHNYENGSYLGIAGIAGGWSDTKGAAIMVLKAGYDAASVSQVAQGLRYAAQKGAQVINMSYQFFSPYSPLEDACDSAANVYDCVLVACAGNQNVSIIRYPAFYSSTIAVGATIEDDTRWDSENAGSNTGTELDIMAPGGDDIIYTTNTGNQYAVFGGTSASAPHVSGVAALLRSIYPNLSWEGVKDRICFSAMKVPQMNGNERTDEYGYGIVNAHNALLLSYAYDSLSLSSTATAYNNGRRLIRDGNNRYHLVFESCGEIFYRRSNIGGTNWEDPVLLSNLRGAQLENKHPSITGTSDKQFVIWQRKTDTNKYDTYFNKNTGTGWINPTTIQWLSGLTCTTDPLPVVSYKTISGGHRLLVCAKGQKTVNGILYQYSDNEGSSWEPVPSNKVPSTSSSHQNPSLSL